MQCPYADYRYLLASRVVKVEWFAFMLSMMQTGTLFVIIRDVDNHI